MQRRVVVCWLMGVLVGCTDGRVDSAGSAAHTASLTEGRTLELLQPSGSTMERVTVRIGDDSEGLFATLHGRLSASCDDAVGARASGVSGVLADGRPIGATADELAHALCMCHLWMNQATAVNQVDVFSDGEIAQRPPLDPNETPTEQLDRLVGTRGLELTLPVPSNASAATFAYLAVESCQDAAVTGAEILELAASGRLNATVRAAAADGPGLSDDPADTTRIVDVVVFQTAEATQRLLQAATLAGGLTSNGAQARLADRGGDRVTNVYASWTAPHDSRSESVGLWTGWADCSCCEGSPTLCISQGIDPAVCSNGTWCAHADDYLPPPIDQCACCAVDPATCPKPEICGPGELCDTPDDTPEEVPRDPGGGGSIVCTTASAEEDRAMAILQAQGVLPDLVATEDEVVDQLAATVRADDPTAPAGLSSRELVEGRYDVSSAAFLRASLHLHERVRVLGLPIVRRRDDASGVPRYDGLRSQPTPEQLAAYTAARTIGENIFDYHDELTSEAAVRDGGRTAHHFAPFAYARQGVLPTLDVVAAALRRALRRTELAPASVIPGRPEPNGTRRVAHAALSLARSQVPQRVRLRVGSANADGIDRLELVLYGASGAVADYALVVGEAGLHCATIGSIAGRPCDLDDYRVQVTPTVMTETNLNGIGDRHLVFTVLGSQLPARSQARGRIRRVRFYLTEREGSSRRVVSAFTPIVGPNAGTYTRTTFIPAVGEGIRTATAAAIPSVDECDEPELCCEGLPCNPRLPRESELVEDRYGANEFESIDEALYRLASEAAAHADALGVEAIHQQLQADAQAHAAAAQLEALCGGVINVESLTPPQCASDPDCCPEGGCQNAEDGGTCVGNVCTFDSLAHAISVGAGPDTSSIEACLGGELVAVNFGSEPLCYFQAVDDPSADDPRPILPPCTCADGDAACVMNAGQCPRSGGPSCDLALAFPGLDNMQYVGEATEPLNAVESLGVPGAPDCEDLAILRGAPSEDERLGAAARLLQAGWLNQLDFAQLGERVGYVPDLFQMGRVTLDGSNWYGSGSVEHGPTADDQFPCHEHGLLVEPNDPTWIGHPACHAGTGDWTLGPPLLCGAAPPTGGCGSAVDRIQINARLFDAATLIAVLGRASGRYLNRPGYKGYNHAVGFEISSDRWTSLASTNSYYDTGFSGWADLLFGDAHGQVAVVGDRMLFRACASSTDCATTQGPDYYDEGLVDAADPLLPYWVSITNSSDETLLGQIVTAFDDANIGPEGHGLGDDDRPDIASDPPAGLGGLAQHWHWLPPFAPGSGAEHQREVRCVRIDNLGGDDDGEAALEFGAVCPTLFAAIPADLGSLDEEQRTSPQVLSDFWSHAPGSAGHYSLHDFLYDVARRTHGEGGPDITQWSVAVTDIEEFHNENAAPYGRVLDALELACVVMHERGGGGCGTDVGQVPQINGPEDFLALERALECSAASVETAIQNAVLFDVPVEIKNDIDASEISATYPGLRGEYGHATSELRASTETISLAVNQMAAALRQLSNDIEVARHQVLIQGLQLDQAELNANMAGGGHIAGCIGSMGGSIVNAALNPGEWTQTIPALIANAGDCVAQALSARAAFKSAQIEEDITNEQQELIYLELQSQFGQHLDSIASAGTLLIQGYAKMQQALTQLDSIRGQAESQAMVVLGQSVDPVTGRENNYLHAQRQWTSVWLQRYDVARRNAVRSAWWARHALEARIGMDLSDMTNDLALVDAPAEWADTLCTMQPLDYQVLRDTDTDVEQSGDYETGFISDYVRLLGLVKDSYPFDFRYQNEEDLTVLSMRDEVFDEVVQCDVEGHNRLLQSADPSIVQAMGVGGWIPEFDPAGDGLDVSPIPGSPFAMFALEDDTLVSRALGGATAEVMYVVPPAGAPDPLAPAPRWRQTVQSLGAGRYVLSWSEQFAEGDDATCAAASPGATTLLDVELRGAARQVTTLTSAEYLDAAQDTSSHPCWRRVRVVLHNPVSQDIDVAFFLPAVATANWAAPQLERVALSADPMTVLPSSFFPTDDDHAFFIGICEDWSGQALRQHFTYQCEPLCPPEFGEHCEAGDYCYWESNFALNVDALMTGESGQFGGIAARSYNHRLRGVAVNLVGTDVRDCERSSRPSVCYASGFLPYSLRAEGGSFRNHFGETVVPPYDPGNVEFARALASERYVTNPLSSADRALLEGYWRRSFHGYPLSALYRLRVVDVPELRWENLRDIQLLLQHTHFTHQR